MGLQGWGNVVPVKLPLLKSVSESTVYSSAGIPWWQGHGRNSTAQAPPPWWVRLVSSNALRGSHIIQQGEKRDNEGHGD